MKSPSIQIIPATPGFYTLVDLPEFQKVVRDEAVLAWAIQTYDLDEGGFSATVSPISINGEPLSNCIGVLNPDGSVSLSDGMSYPSLSELVGDRYKT